MHFHLLGCECSMFVVGKCCCCYSATAGCCYCESISAETESYRVVLMNAFVRVFRDLAKHTTNVYPPNERYEQRDISQNAIVWAFTTTIHNCLCVCVIGCKCVSAKICHCVCSTRFSFRVYVLFVCLFVCV